jgi:hypothetical protein
VVPPSTGGAERPFQNALIVAVIGPRRFPPPWSVEERPTAFVCGDHNGARGCPLTVIIFAYLVPGVLLRKLVLLASIASAIVMTTLVAGFEFYLARLKNALPDASASIIIFKQVLLTIIRDVFCRDRKSSASRQLAVFHFS